MSENNNQENNNMERRELLKGLATVPVFGLFLLNLWQKMRRDAIKKSNILSNLVQENSAPAVIKGLSDSRHLNIGIIGYGGRGSHLIRGAGFATKGWTDTVAENAKKNKLDKNSFIKHLTNNYSKNPAGLFGTFKVNQIISKNLKRFTPQSFFDKLIKKIKYERKHLYAKDVDYVIMTNRIYYQDEDKIESVKSCFEKIKGKANQEEINKEYKILKEVQNSSLEVTEKLKTLFKEIKEVNLNLWNIEDKLRICEKNKDFGQTFIELARSVYLNNDKRSKIKLEINNILDSNIREIKQYANY